MGASCGPAGHARREPAGIGRQGWGDLPHHLPEMNCECRSLTKKGLRQVPQAFNFLGGAERDRTVDLCVANASLSQLSYSPKIDLFLYRKDKPKQRKNYPLSGRITVKVAPCPGSLCN